MTSRRLPLVISLLLFIAVPAYAALVPESDAWERWRGGDEASTVRLGHGEWQVLLDRYLKVDEDGINRFAYAEVTPADRDSLQDYLDKLAAIDPLSLRRDEQFAYWVNMYNAVTVAVILDYYPVKSIRRVEGGLLGLGPWNEELISVQGEALTLNDIEHRILRPLFFDPRIHYAVNCASLGCPNLANEAYLATELERQLDAAARDFINHPRGVALDGKRLQLSSIYKWYQSDFGSDEAGLIEHLQLYAEPGLRDALAAFDGRVRYDYDWQLNEPGNAID